MRTELLPFPGKKERLDTKGNNPLTTHGIAELGVSGVSSAARLYIGHLLLDIVTSNVLSKRFVRFMRTSGTQISCFVLFYGIVYYDLVNLIECMAIFLLIFCVFCCFMQSCTIFLELLSSHWMFNNVILPKV